MLCGSIVSLVAHSTAHTYVPELAHLAKLQNYVFECWKKLF